MAHMNKTTMYFLKYNLEFRCPKLDSRKAFVGLSENRVFYGSSYKEEAILKAAMCVLLSWFINRRGIRLFLGNSKKYLGYERRIFYRT